MKYRPNRVGSSIRVAAGNDEVLYRLTDSQIDEDINAVAFHLARPKPEVIRWRALEPRLRRLDFWWSTGVLLSMVNTPASLIATDAYAPASPADQAIETYLVCPAGLPQYPSSRSFLRAHRESSLAAAPIILIPAGAAPANETCGLAADAAFRDRGEPGEARRRSQRRRRLLSG